MRYSWFYIVLGMFLFPQNEALGADGYVRLRGIDVLHYRIALTIDATDSVIVGDTGIIVSITDGNIKEIPFDLGVMDVDAVTMAGQALVFTHEGEKLFVSLPETYEPGTRLEIRVAYHGQPKDGLFIMKNKFGDRTIFADNFSNRAHHWFPGVDHPYDKATAEFIVTAPGNYDVVANGRLLETTQLPDGGRRTHWRTATEIPTYCMVIGATEFSVIHAGSWNGIPVSYYLYPQDRENGKIDFERSTQMLEFYSGLIGPYPYSKLALVQSTTRYGGMENASSIFFSERSIRGTKRGEGTVAHEIAHQWFGDSITEADWHDVWLSEGFATYFGALFFERTEGRDRFMEIMQGSKERYLRTNTSDSRPIHDATINDLSDVLTSFHYVKGGWTLHMLRGVIGDNAFFAGIKDYYRRFRDKNALTVDFQRVMESHAGQPLEWFFHQWIYEAGHPVYDLEWAWDKAAKEAVVTIRQTQEGVSYRMPLNLGFYTENELVRKRIVSEGREQTIAIPMDAEPDSVQLDPDHWILKEVIEK